MYDGYDHIIYEYLLFSRRHCDLRWSRTEWWPEPLWRHNPHEDTQSPRRNLCPAKCSERYVAYASVNWFTHIKVFIIFVMLYPNYQKELPNRQNKQKEKAIYPKLIMISIVDFKINNITTVIDLQNSINPPNYQVLP